MPFVSKTCEGERCHCGQPAVKKVGEEIPFDDPDPARHNLTAYVCERHYAELMGPVGAKQVGLTRAPVSQDAAQLVERLRHMADNHHAIKDSAAMSQAADLIEALTRVQPSTSSVEAVARALAADIMAAMRRARLPKEYADEAHDEFEALTLVPMLLAALPSPERELMREALRQEIINSPETADFMAGVPIEAAHQRERWGSDHDAGKTPFDWFWLVGYLAQKAATAAVAGDPEKAKHHTISTAAALANWHGALKGETNMRPGIGPMNGGEKPGSAFDLASKLAPPPAQSGDRT